MVEEEFRDFLAHHDLRLIAQGHTRTDSGESMEYVAFQKREAYGKEYVFLRHADNDWQVFEQLRDDVFIDRMERKGEILYGRRPPVTR